MAIPSFPRSAELMLTQAPAKLATASSTGDSGVFHQVWGVANDDRRLPARLVRARRCRYPFHELVIHWRLCFVCCDSFSNDSPRSLQPSSCSSCVIRAACTPLRRSFRRLEDGVIRARLSTAAYVQPNDALRYTGSSGGGPGAGGAPIPNLGNLLSISTEPVVLYSHTIMLRRPAATANGAEAAAAAAAVI